MRVSYWFMKTEHNSQLTEFQSMVLVNAFIFRHTVHDCLDSGGERLSSCRKTCKRWSGRACFIPASFLFYLPLHVFCLLIPTSLVWNLHFLLPTGLLMDAKWHLKTPAAVQQRLLRAAQLESRPQCKALSHSFENHFMERNRWMNTNTLLIIS